MIFLNKFPTVISRHLPFRYTSLGVHYMALLAAYIMLQGTPLI
jgi:hypothetical protein